MYRATILLLLTATALHAQSIPGAVLATREPHHHLAFEDSTLRVLRVRVGAHDTTLLHEHDSDYFWIALGASRIVNAKIGAPDATVSAPDLSVHYAFGPFAHVARNLSAKPFDNITVELLQPQTNVRNMCERAIADKPVDCPSPPPKSHLAFAGGVSYPELETAQVRVFLLTIAPGATLKPLLGARGTWIIALDTADAGRSLVVSGNTKWVGGTAHAPSGNAWTVTNRGQSAVHAIAVLAAPGGRP
jgi:hypothetical protein